MIAVTDAEKGYKGGFTAFIVDRDMGWTSSTDRHDGAVAADLDELRRRPRSAANVLGEVGDGFKLAMEWIGRGRYVIPSQAIGAAERLLPMAIEYANQRGTFGQPIGEHQMIQAMIADCEVELESARWLVLLAAWTVDQGRDPAPPVSMAKLSGATMANHVVDRRDADPRRHGLHPRAADRALVPGGAAVADLRGHRRDPEAARSPATC